MKAAMELAFQTAAPVYLRIGKGDLGPVHTAQPGLEWGRLLPVRPGSGPLVFIATGSMLTLAVKLAEEWPGCAVWSAPSLKPLEIESVVSACGKHRVVVTLEEHNVIGGLGGAVAEILSQEQPLPLCRIGVPDQFSRLCGSYSYLMREHGLDIDSVRARIHAFTKKHSL